MSSTQNKMWKCRKTSTLVQMMMSYRSLPTPILLLCYVYADDIFLFWCLRWFLSPRVQLDCHCLCGWLEFLEGLRSIIHTCGSSHQVFRISSAAALTRRQIVLCCNSQPPSPVQVLKLFVLESLAIFSSWDQRSVNPLTQLLQTLLLSQAWFLTWSPAYLPKQSFSQLLSP